MAARPQADNRVLSHGRGGAGKLPKSTWHALCCALPIARKGSGYDSSIVAKFAALDSIQTHTHTHTQLVQ
jgi:hypothetical protein